MQRRPIPLLVLASRGGSDAQIEAADAVAPADPGAAVLDMLYSWYCGIFINSPSRVVDW